MPFADEIRPFLTVCGLYKSFFVVKMHGGIMILFEIKFNNIGGPGWGILVTNILPYSKFD